MSKFKIQKIINKESVRVLKENLDPAYFDDFIIEGNYEDIDGLIRLGDGKGTYYNKTLHFQLRGIKKLKANKYSCDIKTVKYLIDCPNPTVLLVAEIETNKLFWFFFDEKEKKVYREKKNVRSVTINLEGREVTRGSAESLNARWRLLSKTPAFRELSKSLTDITKAIEENIVKCVGLLYLIKVVKKQEYIELFSKVLSISKQEVELVFRKLREKDIVTETSNLYLLENEQIGIESLLELIADTPISKVEKHFEDKNQKARIREQLARAEDRKAEGFLQSASSQLLRFIQKPTSNDDIYENLEILEKYSFRVPEQTLKIAKAIVNLDPQPQKIYRSKLGSYKGKSHKDLVLKIIEILKGIRYFRPIEVFRILAKLANNTDYKEKSLEGIGVLTEYNLYALRRIEYIAQKAVLEEIESWGSRDLRKNLEVLVKVSSKLLNPEYEGKSMSDYKTLHITFGSLKASDELASIRSRAIKILKNAYRELTQVEDKKTIVKVLNEASRAPFRAYSDELKDIVIENTNSLIDFYIEVMPQADEEIIREIEEQLYRFIEKYEKDKLPKADELLNVISSHKEYALFKVFYGYGHPIDKKLGWQEAKNLREKEIDKFVNRIDEKNWGKWKKRIVSVARRFRNQDYGKFQHFSSFLNKLGKRKPTFASNLIKKEDKVLEPFLIHLIAGIWESDRDTANTIINGWIENNRHLGMAAYLFIYTNSLDLGLIKAILRKAKASGDKKALYNILGVCIEQYKRDKKLKGILIDVLETLTGLKDDMWCVRIWTRDYSVFGDLSSKETKLLLKSLVLHSHLGHQAEEILTPIAKKFPNKVIRFFYERVTHRLKRQDPSKYDDIPYRFYKIQNHLARKEKVVVPEILKWFSQKDYLYHFKASSLLNAIFPSFQSTTLQDHLLELINKGGRRNALLVLSVLRAYKGETFLYKVCKEFVKKYLKIDSGKDYKDFRNEMFIILSQTGVVWGEYGMSNAYEKKKSQIKKWKKDRNKTIKRFVKEYEQYLGDNIKFEKLRSDEYIELMKKGIR